MPNNPHFPNASTRWQKIRTGDDLMLQEVARLVSLHSWGDDYPVDPLSEIRSAAYRIGVFHENQLVAFGDVGKGFSPDGLDQDCLWLGHAVVLPEFRRKGIFVGLYHARMKYAAAQVPASRLRICTDSPHVTAVLSVRGWMPLRETFDESGAACTVFHLPGRPIFLDMSLVRHCSFYPTAKGWFLNLADREHGEYSDADTYGPAPTYYEANRYLYDYFSNPGGENLHTDLRDVPSRAPNGEKIQPIPGAGPRNRSYPASFLSAEAETDDALLYDTARDIVFSLHEGKVERVSSLIFWSGDVPVSLEDSTFSNPGAWSLEVAPQPPLPDTLPTSPGAWEALSRSIAAHWLKIGRTYEPIILAELPRQPLTVDQVAA